MVECGSIRGTPAAGFTLVELLIVISVMAILVGMTIPAIGLIRSNAMAASCMSNQRQMIAGVIAYTAENAGYVPPQDWVAGCDWNTAPNASSGSHVGKANPLAIILGIEGSPPVPEFMSGLQNSWDSTKSVDVMSRVKTTMCPAVRRIFETQAILAWPSINLKNTRPTYVSSRTGPPNLAVEGGTIPTKSLLESASICAKYTKIAQVERLSACGFVFCCDFRLDRLGVALPSNATNDPTTIMPVHLPRKSPVYKTTAFGPAFDPSDPVNFTGRVNVAFLDGHVDGLGYNADPTTFRSLGGSGKVLPAGYLSAPNTPAQYSDFLNGGY